ncbi:hypothetical protein EA187_14355 [Lujinxingia sediminis]|uniref:Uncharacterized protein n=1 Tax=Lujinxingia sediminis TaxID=2480984 RepID=A0ABY0CSA4_9DELT|nr:hypothetical protein [Lujinxingia sediminis]RVU43013.1 hypothetical protein EA187_14355 [Lujinxingia sediminis]
MKSELSRHGISGDVGVSVGSGEYLRISGDVGVSVGSGEYLLRETVHKRGEMGVWVEPDEEAGAAELVGEFVEEVLRCKTTFHTFFY